MLQLFRSHKSKITGILIAGFCALLMIGFWVSTGGSHGNSSGPVASVNGKDISSLQLENRYREISGRLRDQLGDNFAQFEAQLNLKQQALDSLITDILVDEFTNSLGLTASSDQIERKILSSPYFRGNFSQAAFDGYLRAVGMTAQQLEFRMRKDLVREQLTAVTKDLTLLSDGELESAFQSDKAKISLNYLEISADDFKSKVDLSNESELSAFYDQHKESYQTSKQVRFTYVEFKPEEFVDSVDIAEEDIETSYRERQSEFFEPAQAHLRKIFIAAPQDSSKLPFDAPEDEAVQSTPTGREAKKKLAQMALDRLKSGESFETVASALSEDAKSKSAGGDIGWVSESALSTAERKALDELDLQEYSGVLESPEGFSIIYLEEMKKREDKPLEQVREVIVRDLKLADAPMYARISADEFKNKWDASGSPHQPLAEFSKANGRKVQSSGALSSIATPGLPRELFQRALDGNEGDEEVVSVGDSTFVLVIDEIKEPSIPEFSAVHDRVVQEFIQSKSRELAEQFGKELAKDLPATPLAEVATKHQLHPLLSPLTTREEARSGIWSAPGLAEIAFTLQEDGARASDKVFASGRKFYLIELAKRELPSHDEFVKNQSSIRGEKLSASGMRILEALVSVLRANAKISVNTDVLDAV